MKRLLVALVVTIVIIAVILIIFWDGDEADIEAPETLVMPAPVGNNDWISENTSFILTATDNGSGVNYTTYRTWFNDWTEWEIYEHPFLLLGEGVHYVEFYSVDNVGNVENTNNVTYQIDSTPPVTEIEEFPFIGVIFAKQLVISDEYENVLYVREVIIF